MNINVLLCVVSLLTSYCGLTSAVYFEEGYDHHYTYTSESDVLGMHNVTTVIKFRVRCINGTGDSGRLHKLYIDSFVQHSENGYMADNPLNWHLDHRLFQDSSNKVFNPYMRLQLSNVNRFDVVWDVYDPDSLKSGTMLHRGKESDEGSYQIQKYQVVGIHF
ncbi:uncharacterized protein LOC128225699 [Mya arenaria]|uniref:uncharacterized protein LOC128225699 n=1 Tax=Mya arenaria TaxID=6604 RepID=UPI0022E0FC71|nr:uncharacterized protein LOC128225699 [Mya arenaria]